MISRHKYELLSRLERVVHVGTCEFRGSELRLWYGRERLTKAVWTDILEQWDEIDRNQGNTLLVRQEADYFTIVLNDGMTPLANSRWKNLHNWAG